MSCQSDAATSADRTRHRAEHKEYVTVQSALKSFEDRFEAHIRSQSRSLGGLHVALQNHEQHLREQQKRVEQLEELEKLSESRLDLLSSQVRKAEESVATVLMEISRTNTHKQIGRFSVFETPQRTTDQDIGIEVMAKNASSSKAQSNVQGTRRPQYLDHDLKSISKEPSSSMQGATSQTHPLPALGFEPGCKSDEEAWEEYLGFGSRGTDLRPQHSYRKSQIAFKSEEK